MGGSLSALLELLPGGKGGAKMSGTLWKRVLVRRLTAALLLIPIAIMLLYRTPPESLFATDSSHWTWQGGASGVQREGAFLTLQEKQLLARLAQQLGGVDSLRAQHPPTFTRCHHGDWDGYNPKNFSKVAWHPRPGKYMVAACYDGGYSNRMLCITYLAQVAALLDRVLVLLPWPGMILPHQGGDEWITFDLASVIDVDYMASCVEGGGAAIGWEAFQHEMESKGGIVEAEGICFESLIFEPEKYIQPCAWAIKHGLKDYSLSINLRGWVNISQGGIGEGDLTRTMQQAGDPEVLWVLGTHNNIPYVLTPDGGRPSWPYTPVERTCKGSFFQPTPAIMLAAKRFIAGYMGERFASIHLRRNDFIDHLTLESSLDCQYGDSGCFTLSIPQLAECLDRALEAEKLSLLFVASDATNEEIELLKELLRKGGKTIIRIPRLQKISGHRWYQGLPTDDEMVYSVVEKTICAMSSVYISSYYSTFSQDIQRLRYDWGKDTCHDHLICRLE